MVLLLAACTPELAIDLEATCASIWPADSCGAGDCVTGNVEQRWADAFDPALAALTGLRESEVADHARLRTFDGSDAVMAFQSISDGTWQFDVDWMRVVVPFDVSAEVDDPSDAELVAAWIVRLEGQIPADGFDERLIPFSEAQAFVEDCEARLGVTLDAEGWCEPYYGTDPGDDDPTGLRIDLSADLGGGQGELASAHVYLTPGGESTCETEQIPAR